MKVSSLIVGMALLLLMPSCSDESDPIKSYSNYEVVTSISSPIVFSNLGDSKEITVSASKEVCWDGKPSGTTEPVVLRITAEGEQFSVETTQNGGSYQLRITAKENQEEAEQLGKITITTEGEAMAQSQVIELRQDAATVEYRAYKIAFAETEYSFDCKGGQLKIPFTCERMKSTNGGEAISVPFSLNGIRYQNSHYTSEVEIQKVGNNVGEYQLNLTVSAWSIIRDVTDEILFLNEDEPLVKLVIHQSADPLGGNNFVVTNFIDEIYRGE